MNPTKTKLFKGNYQRVLQQVHSFSRNNNIIDSISQVALDGKYCVILFYMPLSDIKYTADKALTKKLALEAYEYTMQLDRLIVG